MGCIECPGFFTGNCCLFRVMDVGLFTRQEKNRVSDQYRRNISSIGSTNKAEYDLFIPIYLSINSLATWDENGNHLTSICFLTISWRAYLFLSENPEPLGTMVAMDP